MVPFYNGTRKDVITVYESSYYFEGYFAQGFTKFYDENYEHYVFLGDDVLLNPNLNEENIQSKLKLLSETSYIPGITPLNKTYSWIPTKRLLEQEFAFEQKGASYQGEIPTFEEAMKVARKYRINNQKWNIRNLIENPKNLRHFKYLFNGNKNLPYPLAYGDSDFFIVSAKDIKEFTKTCGVFSAMKLFAECAIPTAFMLTCKNIRFESSTLKNINLNGTKKEAYFAEQYKCSVKDFYTHWDKKVLRYHPIKLSKWEY